MKLHAEASIISDQYMGNIAWKGIAEDPTGLVLVGTRYYDPLFQRFISPDPLGHEGSWDLYSYANGDHINFWDPTGAFACKAYEVTKPYVSFGLDVLPATSSAKSVAEAVTGQDLITGEKVSRIMAASSVVVGILPGGFAAVKGGAKAAKAVTKTNVVAKDVKFTKPILGGAYDKVRKANVGGEVHHLVADSVSGIPKGKRPAIWMTAKNRANYLSFSRLCSYSARVSNKFLVSKSLFL